MSGVSNLDQFDPSVLDALHQVIGDSVNKIISIYVDDFPVTIQNMRAGLAQQDFEAIGRLAHSLKSSSGNLGATQIVTLSLELEKIISQGITDSAQIKVAIDQLEQAFKQVQYILLGYIR